MGIVLVEGHRVQEMIGAGFQCTERDSVSRLAGIDLLRAHFLILTAEDKWDLTPPFPHHPSLIF